METDINDIPNESKPITFNKLMAITSKNSKANNQLKHNNDLLLNHLLSLKKIKFESNNTTQSLIKNDLSSTDTTDISPLNNHKSIVTLMNQIMAISQNNFSITPKAKSAIEKIEEIKEKVQKSNQLKTSKIDQCLSSLNLLIPFFNGKDLAVLVSTSKSFKSAIQSIIQSQVIQYILTPFIQFYQSTMKIINKKIIYHINQKTKGKNGVLI